MCRHGCKEAKEGNSTISYNALSPEIQDQLPLAHQNLEYLSTKRSSVLTSDMRFIQFLIDELGTRFGNIQKASSVAHTANKFEKISAPAAIRQALAVSLTTAHVTVSNTPILVSSAISSTITLAEPLATQSIGPSIVSIPAPANPLIVVPVEEPTPAPSLPTPVPSLHDTAKRRTRVRCPECDAITHYTHSQCAMFLFSKDPSNYKRTSASDSKATAARKAYLAMKAQEHLLLEDLFLLPQILF